MVAETLVGHFRHLVVGLRRLEVLVHRDRTLVVGCLPEAVGIGGRASFEAVRSGFPELPVRRDHQARMARQDRPDSLGCPGCRVVQVAPLCLQGRTAHLDRRARGVPRGLRESPDSQGGHRDRPDRQVRADRLGHRCLQAVREAESRLE